jgi:O-acetyl-ADP-ribose deacetylase (regulator of RNase III)/uncharacterized protein YwgA
MSSNVKTLKGNLLDSKAQTLVNTVNCVGVMGKGIALEFKNHFPKMYQDYLDKCKRGDVKLGRPYLYRGDGEPWILNFPTKDHWRSVSRIKDIEKGLQYLADNYKQWGIQSLAVPPLGCGHGQLEWKVVGRTLYRYLSRMEIPVELYAPYDAPDEELQLDFLAQMEALVSPAHRDFEPKSIKSAWVAFAEVLNRLEKEPYSWPVGRTTFQKIAYVGTRSGIPSGLSYQRGSYGPFSPGVKKIITRLDNNGVIQEERWQNMFQIKVGPTFKDAQQIYSSELHQWESILDKVTDLFTRVNSKQAEVVATVLYIYDELRLSGKRPISEGDVLAEVMSWKQRRRPHLVEEEVANTIRNLAALNWLEVKPSSMLPVGVGEFDIS